MTSFVCMLTPVSACSNYLTVKRMLHGAPEVLHAFLDRLTESLITYVCYQIDSGAQVSVQASIITWLWALPCWCPLYSIMCIKYASTHEDRHG